MKIRIKNQDFIGKFYDYFITIMDRVVRRIKKGKRKKKINFRLICSGCQCLQIWIPTLEMRMASVTEFSMNEYKNKRAALELLH